MYEAHDVHAFFPAKSGMERNHLTQTRNTLVYALNNNEKLPKHLIILLDNSFVQLAPMADVIIKWIVTEVWRAVAARFEFLPKRAKPDHPVNILIIKPLPCPVDMIEAVEYIEDRHQINHFLEKETRYFKFVSNHNIDAIRPRDGQYFNPNGALTGAGYT